MSPKAREEGKKLTIIMYNLAKPTFVFDGVWTGKDIGTVQGLLRREYLRHQQTLRRESATTQPAPSEQVKEA
jgi:hypothetical protein